MGKPAAIPMAGVNETTSMYFHAQVAFWCLLFAPMTCLGQSVVNNPYEAVNWSSDLRCNAQFHDHAHTTAKLRTYEKAGYCFASYFDYSGNPERDYAWDDFHWPVNNWLGSGVEESLANLTLFPNVEQISPNHWTSPWFDTFLEYKPGGTESYQYETPEEGFALAREHGALPILAHPWGNQDSITGMHAVEIYNGYGLNKYLDGTFNPSLNDKLVPYWDRQLAKNPRLFGVAVNDWFGPFSHITDPSLAWAQDTGKQILLVPERTSEAAKEAFRAGAMFALVDKNSPKGGYPYVNSINVSETSIRIDTDAVVRWISMGSEIATGAELDLSIVTGNYVRAEISNETGILYTQPWEIGVPTRRCDFNSDGECDTADVDSLMPAQYSEGDFNGDGTVTAADLNILGQRWLTDAPMRTIAVAEPTSANLVQRVVVLAVAATVRRVRRCRRA